MQLLEQELRDLPQKGPAPLKMLLGSLGVDCSKCAEKQGLIDTLLVAASRVAANRVDGWVRKLPRSLNDDLDWLPAASFAMAAQIPGLSLYYTELRAAAALPFQRKLQWFRQHIKRLQIPWGRGHVKVRVRIQLVDIDLPIVISIV